MSIRVCPPNTHVILMKICPSEQNLFTKHWDMSNNEEVETSYTMLLCLLFKVYSYISKQEANF